MHWQTGIDRLRGKAIGVLMQNTLLVFMAVIFSALAGSAPGQTARPRYSKMPDPIALNGKVELTSLSIKRQKTGDPKQDAEASTMELQLYLGNFSPEELWHTKLQITELAPVEDETGKLLSTEKRLEAMPTFKGNVPVKVQRRSDETAGAIATLTLDAPARAAARLKVLAGKAVLSHSRLHHVRFMEQTAAELHGKPLEHPKMAGHKVVPTVEFKDGITTVTLTMPADFPTLVSFGLLNGEGKPEGFKIAASGSRQKVNVSKEQFHRYQGDQTGKTHLVLNFSEDDAPQLISFEFKDVELP
jgi:hypothetical protein